MTVRFGLTDSLAGPFGYLWTGDGSAAVVLASGWTTDPDRLLGLVHRSLRPPEVTDGRHRDLDAAVAGYSSGELAAIDTIRVRQHSGPFLRAAWDALRRVRPGSATTYTELAALAGRPAAIRAAAAACASNAAALFVPCHRITRTDGGLGGFAYGLDVKRHLLAHEHSP
jgi:methylated-DNA-[protein]-cysteine S-methyltransferase